jgi:hypothetical protein
MRVKAGNSLSSDAGVLDLGSSASLTETNGHVTVTGVGSLPAGTLGQFAYNTDGGSSYATGRPVTVIDAAKEFGVDFTLGILGADQGPAIQNALDAAYTQSGGTSHGCIVQLPPGAASLRTALEVKQGTWLRGHGPTTSELYVPNGSLTSVPLITVDNTSGGSKVSDLVVAVSSAGTSAQIGISMLLGSAAFSTGGVYSELERVFILNTGGSGIKLASLECRLINCYVRTAKPGSGPGYEISGTDNFLWGCTADTCGAQGFQISGGNNKFFGNKAFGCGGSGFNITGSRHLFSTCEAQDNDSYGFNDANGGGHLFDNCLADTNGQGGGTQYGFMVKGLSIATGCRAENRSGTPQTYGFGGAAAFGQSPTIIGKSYLPGTADLDPSRFV